MDIKKPQSSPRENNNQEHITEIKDYFLIGDLQSAALVSKEGSIDWLCLPYFDSPGIFSKLLDKNGGEFSILPGEFEFEASYVPSTAVMESKYSNKICEFKVYDFMVPQPDDAIEDHFLVREIECVRGKAEVKFLYNPKPGYGKIKPEIRLKDSSLYFSEGDDSVILYIPDNAWAVETPDGWEITIKVEGNETAALILEYLVKGELPAYTGGELKHLAVKFWQDWISKGKFTDFCKKDLIRSAITLKLMQFAPTGALIAAPTTSLPEEIGGVRNWDYRYVWIRDATFILYAFYILDYTDEAVKFFDFIHSISEAISEDEWDINLVYTIHGKPVPVEKDVPHLSGYKGSRPVRTGNGAAKQFQLDVYGALIDAHYFVSKRGIAVTDNSKRILLKLAYKIRERWREKDSGIWEVRSGDFHFTYSKVMAWVGINRILRMADQLKIGEKDKAEFGKLEKEILHWIKSNCYDGEHELLQHPENHHIDATNFLFVLLQYLDKRDSATKKIIANTCKRLCHDDVFVYRYFAPDGLPGSEGAFLLCSFWYISALAILEEPAKARELLFKLRDKFSNGSGLLSEEIDPSTGEFLGNYPQAFSHLGLILTAHYINKYSQGEALDC